MRGVNATPSNPLMEAIHSETTLLILSSLLARTLQAYNALTLNIESLLTTPLSIKGETRKYNSQTHTTRGRSTRLPPSSSKQTTNNSRQHSDFRGNVTTYIHDYNIYTNLNQSGIWLKMTTSTIQTIIDPTMLKGQQIFILVHLGKIIYAWKTLLIDQPIGESLYSPHRLLKNLLLIDKMFRLGEWDKIIMALPIVRSFKSPCVTARL